MSTFAAVMEPTPLARFLGPHAEGAGHEIAVVERKAGDLRQDYVASFALTYREAFLSEIFRELADEWRQETRFESSMSAITSHRAYRNIISLGDEVVPLLLRELRRRPEPWFAALRELTGADPVKPEHRGDTGAMADAWLRWGGGHGLIR
jgi:hypothetical protein